MRLIISEKAIAGKKIASILSNNNFTEIRKAGTPVFEFRVNKIDYILIPLSGHINSVDFYDIANYWSLYNLDTLVDKKLVYKPVKISIINELKKQRKDLEEIIVATDADREGEAIGLEAYNYVKIKNPKSKLTRAYFSALTEKEINDAFGKLKKLDVNYANSVFARQEIDLLWGAILTRYLSVVANRKGKNFLSAGRVQTPLLNLIVERELERLKFVPEKYKLLSMLFTKNKLVFEGNHKAGKIFDLDKADEIYNKVKDAKEGIVTNIKTSEKTIKKPAPFNTTSFLRAASAIGVGTNKAMSIAESLYQQGFISYPRTDNTVYPNSIDFKGLLNKFKKYPGLEPTISEILKKPIKPSRGKKQTTDHPPIYPVDLPTKASSDEKKIFDLIIRRFISTLYIDAKTLNQTITIDVKKELFIVNGQRIIEPGWKKIYIFSQLNEVILPALEKNDVVKIKDINFEEKETTPPNRYTEGGLIKLMEDNNLGTKSTRPAIIQKLKFRNYIQGSKNIEPTKIAIAVCKVLNKHADKITKPKLTADTETQMDLVAAGKKEKEEVVNETRDVLHKIIKILLKEKTSIGSEIKAGINDANYIGKCPVCGNNLVIRHGRSGKQFVGCMGYPKCKQTYPLPQRRIVKPLDKTCEVCGAPMVLLTGGRSKDVEFCLNPKCDSKKEYLKNLEEKRRLKNEKNKSIKNSRK